jgi:hypothetical protein
MRNEITRGVRAFGTLALTCVVVALLATSAQARSKSCGTFRAHGSTLAVSVLRGSVTCATAQHVLSDFFHGKGRLHGPINGPAYLQTWSVDGWTCGYGAGGGACIRGGNTYTTAHYRIEALMV